MCVVVITCLHFSLLSWPQQLKYGLLFANNSGLTHRFAVACSTNRVTTSGSYCIIMIIANSNSVNSLMGHGTHHTSMPNIGKRRVHQET